RAFTFRNLYCHQPFPFNMFHNVSKIYLTMEFFAMCANLYVRETLYSISNPYGKISYFISHFEFLKYKYSFNISELIIYVSHFTEIVSFHCNKNVAFLYIKIYVYINILNLYQMLKFKI